MSSPTDCLAHNPVNHIISNTQNVKHLPPHQEACRVQAPQPFPFPPCRRSLGRRQVPSPGPPYPSPARRDLAAGGVLVGGATPRDQRPCARGTQSPMYIVYEGNSWARAISRGAIGFLQMVWEMRGKKTFSHGWSVDVELSCS